MHPFLWDLYYAPVPGVRPDYPISAVYMNTTPDPTSPWALPGKYTVALTVNGRTYSQPLEVRMDPRVTTEQKDLAEQFKLSNDLYQEWMTLSAISESSRPTRMNVSELRSRIPEAFKQQFEDFSEGLSAFSAEGGGGPGAQGAQLRLAVVTGRLRTLFNAIEGVDLAPTLEQRAAAELTLKDAHSLEQNWRAFRMLTIPAFNQQLEGKGLPQIAVPK